AGAVGRPVELRLPGWLLGLLGLTALAALGLAFQVGHHVAGRSAQPGGDVVAKAPEGGAVSDSVESGAEQTGRTLASAADAPDLPSGPVGPMNVIAHGSEDELRGGIAWEDPRAPGRNYFVLSTVRPSEVEGVKKLQRFLADGGLATYLDTTNNGRFRVLVDVTRGYTREERSQGLHDAHEQRIRELGRRWQRQHSGRGTDLSDLYLDYFRGVHPPRNPRNP
ncbi:MAG: hypothetical protein AAFX76_10315, partial [Planctomycetota bacterium]